MSTNLLNYLYENHMDRRMTKIEKQLHKDGWGIETRYAMELSAANRIAKKKKKIVRVYYEGIPWFAVTPNGEIF